MKGLILKDFYNLSNYKKVLLFLILFYGVLGFATDSIASMLGVIIVLSAALTPTLFSYDEFSKWDCYALSMPLTRRDVVLARYIVSAILVAASTILTGAMIVIAGIIKPDTNTGEAWLSLKLMLAFALFFISIMMPVCYKIGPEKGRLYMMASIFLPIIGTFVLKHMGFSAPTEQQLLRGSYALLLLAVLFVVISYIISCRIFEKKEL